MLLDFLVAVTKALRGMIFSEERFILVLGFRGCDLWSAHLLVGGEASHQHFAYILHILCMWFFDSLSVRLFLLLMREMVLCSTLTETLVWVI